MGGGRRVEVGGRQAGRGGVGGRNIGHRLGRHVGCLLLLGQWQVPSGLLGTKRFERRLTHMEGRSAGVLAFLYDTPPPQHLPPGPSASPPPPGLPGPTCIPLTPHPLNPHASWTPWTSPLLDPPCSYCGPVWQCPCGGAAQCTAVHDAGGAAAAAGGRGAQAQ